MEPDLRHQKWPDICEFWESTEQKEFRIYYTNYAEIKKFKRWIRVHVNYFDPEKDKTLDQILDEKFGKFDDYTDYNKVRENKEVAAVYHYSPNYFMDKNEKILIEHEPFIPPKYISPEDGEIFDYEEITKQEARKAAKGAKEEAVDPKELLNILS